jgi:hypothetical protein
MRNPCAGCDEWIDFSNDPSSIAIWGWRGDGTHRELWFAHAQCVPSEAHVMWPLEVALGSGWKAVKAFRPQGSLLVRGEGVIETLKFLRRRDPYGWLEAGPSEEERDAQRVRSAWLQVERGTFAFALVFAASIVNSMLKAETLSQIAAAAQAAGGD